MASPRVDLEKRAKVKPDHYAAAWKRLKWIERCVIIGFLAFLPAGAAWFALIAHFGLSRDLVFVVPAGILLFTRGAQPTVQAPTDPPSEQPRP